MTRSAEKGLAQLEKMLDLYLKKKAPALPKKWKSLIVDFAPWLNIILMVIAIPAVLAVFGITGTIAAYWGVRLGLMYYISLAFLGLTLVIRGMAIPGLLAKNIKGWRLLYYSTFLDFVYSLLSGGVVGPVISVIIALYLLFQIREYYKK